MAVLRAAPAADQLEVEPDDAAGPVAIGNHAAFHVELVEFLLDFGDSPEGLQQRPVGLLAERRMVDLDALQHALAEVDAAVDVQNIEALLEQRDRRQEIVALEPVLVQIVRTVVRSHAADDSEIHHPPEQPADDHGVGNIVHVQFVEADEAIALGDALGERAQGIFAALQLLELAVHVAHEVVESHAPFPDQRQAPVEAVHQEALSPADPAPQVHAARQRRVHHQALERRAAPRLVGGPLLVELLQPLDRAQLGGIAFETAAFKRLVVETDDRQSLRGALQFLGGLWRALAHQMLSARLSTASAASFMASESDGCAWQIMPMSSLLARNSMATTASAISSEANAPMMCTPNTDAVLGVHIIGAFASELIAEAVVAMEFRASSEDIGMICHAHPSLSEAMKDAALAVDKRALNI